MCVSGFPTLPRFFAPTLNILLWIVSKKLSNLWENAGKIYWKMWFLYKIFWQNKMLFQPTIPSFFRAETGNTYIFFWPYNCCRQSEEKFIGSLLEFNNICTLMVVKLSSQLQIVCFPTCIRCCIYCKNPKDSDKTFAVITLKFELDGFTEE